jgi:hypothetical protein
MIGEEFKPHASQKSAGLDLGRQYDPRLASILTLDTK